ncbi:MAG: dephospho-CoA kinase [SAR324 cluster bacterium]|nr:dephospho-CoA kinase [SAR324 cluster bacterium]
MPERSPAQPPILVVGLTGGIASGKSSVSRLLAEKGAHVIDADSVGHRVIAPDGEAHAEVVAAFGEGILAGDGTIDRRKLGALVFAGKAQLERLNAISHPRMAALMGREIEALRARAQAPPLIVLDAAILLEAGWDVLCDEVWVVAAAPEVAVARLMARDGFAREEAQARLDAQMSNEQRGARAQRVIRNDGDLADLHRQVESIWREAVREVAAS